MSDLPRLPAPSNFWSRAEVLYALQTQDAGTLLCLVRQYCGASQQEIGAAVELAQPHVSRIMSGKQQVSTLQSWQRLADGLGMAAVTTLDPVCRMRPRMIYGQRPEPGRTSPRPR